MAENAHVTEIIRPSWISLESVVAKAQETLLICSPWLASTGLEWLYSYFRRAQRPRLREVQFWARVADPNTDSELLLALVKHLQGRGVDAIVKDSAVLHAKIYLADNRQVLLTSANLSLAGFETNLETGLLTSAPTLIDQIRAVVEEMADQMQPVSLDDLEFFVREQRPEILAHQRRTLSQVEIIPVWRRNRTQSPLCAPGDYGKTAPASIGSIEDVGAGTFDPMEVVEHYLKKLDDERDRLNAIDLNALTGRKLRVHCLRPNRDALMFHIMMAHGQTLETFEGTLEGPDGLFDVSSSFWQGQPTGKQGHAWRFRPKRRRKTILLVNFPLAKPRDSTDTPYYLNELQIL